MDDGAFARAGRADRQDRCHRDGAKMKNAQASSQYHFDHPAQLISLRNCSNFAIELVEIVVKLYTADGLLE